jgi:hypothetical protein
VLRPSSDEFAREIGDRRSGCRITGCVARLTAEAPIEMTVLLIAGSDADAAASFGAAGEAEVECNRRRLTLCAASTSFS